MTTPKHVTALFLTLILTVFIIACGEDKKNTDTIQRPEFYQSNGKLSLASDCGVIGSYFRDNAKSRIKQVFQQNRKGYEGNGWLMPSGEIDTLSSDTTADLSTLEYSETNVQEKGVDEADIVKTDGGYLYVLNGTYFCILQSWPAAELKEVSRIELKFRGSELFLTDKEAVIISNIYPGENSNMPFKTDSYNLTGVLIYDITDRSRPFLKRQTFFEGSYMTSRKIGDLLYVVIDSCFKRINPYDLINLDQFKNFDYEDMNNGDEGLEESMLDYVSRCPLEDLMPRMFEVPVDDSGLMSVNKGKVQCGNYYIPGSPNGDGILSINTFDLSELKGDVSTVSIVANSGTVYASKENLYIASRNCRYWYWYEWDKNSGWTEKTYVYKFRLGASPEYLACGEVDGYIINQFSMGEHESHFRIATTSNGWTWPTAGFQYNNIFILKQNGEGLEIAGKLENFAPGERIYAVRFMGDRGYIVTFLQTDPLFCLDLSNPEKPVISGELEMFGYSSYLHPLGENYLIGIGMNADVSGRIDGLQLSLFNVADPGHPKKIASTVIGSGWSTWSDALYNHKAFQFYEPLGILSIPVQHWSGGYDNGGFFNGALLFKITTDPASIEPFAEISHSDFYIPEKGWWNWNREVRRTVFIGSGNEGFFVYTVSGVGVKVNGMDDIKNTIAAVPLPNSWENNLYLNWIDQE